MMLGFHGGKCCAIKVIHGFYYHPDEMAGDLEQRPFNDSDACGDDVSSNDRFFTDAAPEETYRERLDRFLAFNDKHRPCGIVEVVLSDDSFYQQRKWWEGILLERGFRLINENMNSNSDNVCYVYHRNSNLPYYKCEDCGGPCAEGDDLCENCRY